MAITKRMTLSLLICNILFILGETIFFRKKNSTRIYHFQLFWSYEKWDYYGPQIIANVVLFIPLGFLLGKLIGWIGIVAAIGISVVIELIQLLTLRGVFEFDDIIHNTAGALIGMLCWMFIRRLSNDRGEES